MIGNVGVWGKGNFQIHIPPALKELEDETEMQIKNGSIKWRTQKTLGGAVTGAEVRVNLKNAAKGKSGVWQECLGQKKKKRPGTRRERKSLRSI